jgi:hypothetical protein
MDIDFEIAANFSSIHVNPAPQGTSHIHSLALAQCRPRWLVLVAAQKS